MSRLGGSADGTLGVVLSWWGVITLTCGLYLMFDGLAQQQALIEKLRAGMIKADGNQFSEK